MGKVPLYGQPRGTTNLTIVAMVGILLWWKTLVDDAGVAAYNDDSEPSRKCGPYGQIILEKGRVPDTATANCRAACEACSTCCSPQETSTPRPSGGGIEKKGEPTIVPSRCGDPQTNAESFYNAMNVTTAEGDKFLVDFLSRCTFAERSRVTKLYRTKYRQEMSDAWSKRIYACPTQYYYMSHTILEDTAVDSLVKFIELMIKDNVDSLEAYESALLIESSDSDPISAAIRRNDTVCNKLKEIASNKTKYDGKFLRILDSQLNGTRSSSASVDDKRAREDAEKIRLAIDSQKWTNDDNDFHDILMTTSYPQLRKVLKYYKALERPHPEAAIDETFAPPVAKAYNDILRYAWSKAGYFEKIFEAVDVLFITVWRSEIDLVEIKEAYRRKYNYSFPDGLKKMRGFQQRCDLEKNVWLAMIGG